MYFNSKAGINEKIPVAPESQSLPDKAKHTYYKVITRSSLLRLVLTRNKRKITGKNGVKTDDKKVDDFVKKWVSGEVMGNSWTGVPFTEAAGVSQDRHRDLDQILSFAVPHCAVEAHNLMRQDHVGSDFIRRCPHTPERHHKRIIRLR